MKINHFEFLRGFAALWVFFSHVCSVTNLKIPFISRGGLAVELFIILSGFVITVMIRDKREVYSDYIFRRWARLYPLFLLALAVGIATSSLYSPVFGNSPWLDAANTEYLSRQAAQDENFLTHLFLHLTMLHGAVPADVVPHAALAFSGPLWSISLEWQFYLVAPLIIALISFGNLKQAAISLVTVVVLLAIEVGVSRYWRADIGSFLPLQLHLFALGILCGVLWQTARAASPLVLAGFVLAAIAIICVMFKSVLPMIIWMITYYLAAIHDKTSVGRAVSRLASTVWGRFVGRVSYGFYVLHVPVLLLLSYFVVIPLLADARSEVAAIALIALGLPITFMAAHLCFQYIEKPAIDWAKRRIARAPAAERPAVT